MPAAFGASKKVIHVSFAFLVIPGYSRGILDIPGAPTFVGDSWIPKELPGILFGWGRIAVPIFSFWLTGRNGSGGGVEGGGGQGNLGNWLGARTLSRVQAYTATDPLLPLQPVQPAGRPSLCQRKAP